MSVAAGQVIAHYRLIEKLGEGGMGQVWVAEDTRLKRQVAFKLLPPELAADPERRSRFEREAQAVAALNHPNIVTIHSVEEGGGVHFITMELVRGRTLTERIPKDGLPLARIFEYAIPLADALAAAHAKGITHRDLKPDNIVVGDDGTVKVLDFGLARLADGTTDGAIPQHTATMTQEGKILGTPSYMSPEQAEGKPVDHRTDIFSFGVVLYEMASGRRPFRGDTAISVISAIMRETPAPVTDLNGALPRHLGRIVRRALHKEPGRRYQTAIDLRNELEELKGEVDSGALDESPVVARSPAPAHRALWIAGAVVLGAALVGLGWLLRGGGAAEAPAAGAVSATFAKLTTHPGQELFPSLAPDGRSFVYVGTEGDDADIFLQRVGGSRPVNLTEDSPDDDFMPAFSPDGERIAFVSSRGGGGIFVMGALGESVRRLTDFGFNPSWSPDGSHLAFDIEAIFEPRNRTLDSPLWVVDVESGETRKVIEGDAVQPSWSPDGRRLVYWRNAPNGAQRDLRCVDAAGGEETALTDDPPLDWNPIWSPDDHFVYFSSDRGGSQNLWRLPMVPGTCRTAGAPVPITTPTRGVGHLSIAADGRSVAFVSSEARSRIERVALDLTTGSVGATPVRVYETSNEIRDFALSPDGQLIAFSTTGEDEDLFVVGTDGGGEMQLTDDPAKDRGLAFAPDGSIVFYSSRGDKYEVWRVRTDGSGLEQVTQAPDNAVWFPRVSPDGATMIARNEKGGVLYDLRLPLDQRTPRPMPKLPDGKVFMPHAWSPDGEAILGYANPSAGRIYLYSVATETYRDVAESTGFTVFTPDGRALLLVGPDGVSRFDLSTGRSTNLTPGAIDATTAKQIVLAADGKSFFVLSVEREGDVWLATLD